MRGRRSSRRSRAIGLGECVSAAWWAQTRLRLWIFVSAPSFSSRILTTDRFCHLKWLCVLVCFRLCFLIAHPPHPHLAWLIYVKPLSGLSIADHTAKVLNHPENPINSWTRLRNEETPCVAEREDTTLEGEGLASLRQARKRG